jgi:hypothetical protein
MLKKLSSEAISAITYLFNKIWLNHHIPKNWKEADVLMLKKPEKN